MDDKTKQILLGVVVLVALGYAVFAGIGAFQPEEAKVNIVGELPMPEGGGRDSERGASGPVAPGAGQEAVADQASGMPADMANPGR